MADSTLILDSDQKSNRPKYQRICDHIHAEIRGGRLMPGQALPPEARLVETLGLSRNTIRQAFAQLESEGIIERIQGRGTFVTTEQQRQSRQQLDLLALIAPQLRSGCYPSLIAGFEEKCTDFQHQTLVSSSNNDVARQADLILQLIHRSVGGVAIVPTTSKPTPEYQIAQLQRNQIPVVLCHRTVTGIKAPSVVFSGHEIGLLAGRNLRQLGHKRIGMFFGNRYSMVNEREEGLRDALTEDGTLPGEVVSVEYGSSMPAPDERAKQAIHRTLDELFSRPNPPTALFCGNTPDAEQVYLHAESLGLKVPRDLSILYFGGTWREHGLAEKISCLAVDEHAMGACAAQLLREMRTGKRSIDDDEQITFPISLLPGETIGHATATDLSGFLKKR